MWWYAQESVIKSLKGSNSDTSNNMDIEFWFLSSLRHLAQCFQVRLPAKGETTGGQNNRRKALAFAYCAKWHKPVTKREGWMVFYLHIEASRVLELMGRQSGMVVASGAGRGLSDELYRPLFLRRPGLFNVNFNCWPVPLKWLKGTLVLRVSVISLSGCWWRPGLCAGWAVLDIELLLPTGSLGSPG